MEEQRQQSRRVRYPFQFDAESTKALEANSRTALDTESTAPLDEEPRRKRYRFRLDAESTGVIDDEIERLGRSGPMVRLTRRQALSILVARARRCQCRPEERELPVVRRPVEAPPPCGVVEGDELTYRAISQERQKTDACGSPLSRQQAVRLLVLRAARCRCAG